jgi:uncharacterized protein YacL
MSIKVLFKNIKELGLKEVMKRAKEGIAQAPMDKLIKVELNGIILSIIGTLFAGIMLLIFAKTYWYIIFAFIFSIVIYVSQYLQRYQMYKQFKLLSEMTNPEQVKEENKESQTYIG